MTLKTLILHPQSPEETAQYATSLATRLDGGDVILLVGDVGAGKTHFARALIQSMMNPPEDVPSPTFTLVQTYHTARGDVWHADLYRLTSTHEIEELGLTDAFQADICLVEWPDRLGTLAPTDALTLSFAPAETDEARQIVASWKDPRWAEKLKVWQQ